VTALNAKVVDANRAVLKAESMLQEAKLSLSKHERDRDRKGSILLLCGCPKQFNLLPIYLFFFVSLDCFAAIINAFAAWIGVTDLVVLLFILNVVVSLSSRSKEEIAHYESQCYSPERSGG
jgi:hypothetical protein